MVRSLRAALSLALCASLATPVAARAATAATLTVRATGTASVDVTFRAPVTVDPWRSVVQGGTSYAGFYVQPLAGDPAGGRGMVDVRAFQERGYQPFPPVPGLPASLPLPLGKDHLAGIVRPLPAGHYRVHVFGDGAVTARIWVSHAVGGPLVASRRGRSTFAVADTTPSTRGVPGGATLDLPFAPASAHTMAWSAIHQVTHGYGPSDNLPMSCIGRPEHPACVSESNNNQGAGYHGRNGVVLMGTLPVNQTVIDDVYARIYYPGQLPGDTAAAHFTTVTTAMLDRVVFAAFSLAV
jgi:hypothetical protein